MSIGRFSFAANVNYVLREFVSFVVDVSGVGALAASLSPPFPYYLPSFPSSRLPPTPLPPLLSPISLHTTSLLCMQSQSLNAVAIASQVFY